MYSDTAMVRPQVEVLRERMDPTALATAWAVGRAMTIEQAMASALAV